MRFTVVTIFPEFFSSPLEVGLLGKAREMGRVTIDLVQPRDFTTDRHRTVDDSPFGGGPGMVMMVEPLVAALESIAPAESRPHTVLLSPRGRTFNQQVAREYVDRQEIIFLCGRYEGIDERLVEGGWVDEELSLGDVVLNGGETVALAVIEACSRLLPGAMGNEESVPNDSFFHDRLEYPHYTRPREFRELTVPEVLLSGDHARIEQWRRKEALQLTLARRPDLLDRRPLTEEERRLLEE